MGEDLEVPGRAPVADRGRAWVVGGRLLDGRCPARGVRLGSATGGVPAAGARPAAVAGARPTVERDGPVR
ncbi:hypothetical protein GCM10027168_32420 [Streptomyces capparidis]